MPLKQATNPLPRMQALRVGLNRMPAGLPPDQLTPFSLSPITIQANSQTFGSTLTRVFPLGQQVALWSPGIDVKLLSISLATSMSNVTPDGTMAAWVARYTGNLQVLGQTGIVYVEHLVQAGLAHSQRGGQDYVLETAPVLHHGDQLAIYVSNSGTGVASNQWAVSASIRYTEILGQGYQI